MRRHRKSRVLIAVVGVSLIAASCGSDDDNSASDPAAAATAADTATTPTTGDAMTGSSDTDATDSGSTATTAGSTDESDGDVCTADRVGGEVTMGMLSYPPSLDPVANRGPGSNGTLVSLAIFDSLMRYVPATDEFVPQVAESLTPNDDKTAWTLKLRDGVTFGNGDPLTADAVKASFARHQDPANKSVVVNEAKAVTDMEVVDDHTLIFHLDGPWLRFPAMLANTAGMITDQAVVDQAGDGFGSDPLGAGVGPYELERWTPGEEIVLKAKDNWWGGPVCIQKIHFTFVVGGQGTYESFKSGDFQLAHLRDAALSAQAAEEGYAGLTYNVNASSIFSLNNVSGPTQSLTVRQAIAAAIDPDVINDRVYEGLGQPTTAIIGESSVHYRGVEGPEPDAAKAKELVAQAKSEGWDGHLNLLCINGPEQQEVCITIQAMMQQAGIDVSVESAEVNAVIPRVLEKNYEMATYGFAVDETEPLLRLGPGLRSGASLNETGYSSPDMDAALQALRSAPDQDAYDEALAEIQEIWNRDLPKLIYLSSTEEVLVDESLHGMKMVQNGNVSFDQAYLEQ